MLRPWTFAVQLKYSSQTPIYLQIVHAFIEEIRRGRLKSKMALPGTRALSTQLGVSRKTIVAAYEELVAQGWVVTESTRGTFVAPDLPTLQRWSGSDADSGDGISVASAQDERCLWARKPEAMPWIERSQNYLLFDDGTPDPRLTPVNELSSSFRRALSRITRRGELGYGDPRGAFALRQAISTMLNSKRGLATTANNICITRGSQMALYLAVTQLVQPGDFVAIEELSYPPARATFLRAGANVIPIPVDMDGIDINRLEKACEEYPIKTIYLTPHHHFPTTVSLKPDRRLRLMDLSRRKNIVILEDDYDHEFHFDSQPLLPLASDSLQRIVYIGSLSKLISPSLRLGYFATDANFVNEISYHIMLIDRQGSQPMETAIAELMNGEIGRYARKVHGIYGKRRNWFAQFLTRKFGDDILFNVPAGGLAFWIRFRQPVSIDRLIEAAQKEHLRILPSNSFYSNNQPPEGLRLGFASLDNAELEEAVERLHNAYRRALPET